MSVPRRLGIGGVYSPDVAGSSRTIQSSRALLQQKLNDNGMPIADSSDATTSSTPSSPASRPSSPGGYNSNLYSPKPSPGVRVNVASPAPSSGSAPPASYTVLPALDRSHRYVITGTLQQSLFGVVKLAFDRQLKVQVAIKISRRERAQQQQTRSGVSVLENVRREAAVMRYMHERSASANSAHASAESLSKLAIHNDFTDNGSGKKVKLSSRALQHVKAQEEQKRKSLNNGANKDGMMEDDTDMVKHNQSQPVPLESDTDSAHESDSDSDDTRMSSPATPGAAVDPSDVEGEKYICKFIEELEDEYFHYLISEFVPAGDLYSMLTSYPQHRLAEAQARGLFRQMVLGMKYLHERNVAHLDMSLENMCQSHTHIFNPCVRSRVSPRPPLFCFSSPFPRCCTCCVIRSRLGRHNSYHRLRCRRHPSLHSNHLCLRHRLLLLPLRLHPSAHSATRHSQRLSHPLLRLQARQGAVRQAGQDPLHVARVVPRRVAWDAYANDVFSLGVILYSLLTGTTALPAGRVERRVVPRHLLGPVADTSDSQAAQRSRVHAPQRERTRPRQPHTEASGGATHMRADHAAPVDDATSRKHAGRRVQWVMWDCWVDLLHVRSLDVLLVEKCRLFMFRSSLQRAAVCY